MCCSSCCWWIVDRRVLPDGSLGRGSPGIRPDPSQQVGQRAVGGQVGAVQVARQGEGVAVEDLDGGGLQLGMEGGPGRQKGPREDGHPVLLMDVAHGK